MKLKSNPLFKGLSDQDYESLFENSFRKKANDGDWLFRRGEKADYLFVVESGLVRMLEQKHGKEEVVCMVPAGEFFCLAPLLSRDEVHISAQAVGECELFLIKKSSLENLIDSSHEFSKRVIRFLAGKECDLCEEVCSLSLCSTKERLVQFLLQQSQGRRSFALQMSQSQLAAKLGTVREVVSRDLRALKNAGWLSWEGKSYELLNEKALRELL